MGTRDWITSACKRLGIEESVRLVEPHRYRGVLERIVAERTTLSKDGISALWWWEALREPVSFRQPPDPVSTLERIVPKEELVWFVAEASGPKEVGNFWLYEGNIAAICAVLRDCPAFEYYVVARKLDWLVCENHHGYLIASGQPIVAALSEHRPG
jgi:hypothetical protein